jgi:predicted nucleic acid-binding protein
VSARGDLPLLADTSAWARVRHFTEHWEAAIIERRIAICGVIELELLYSARTRADVTSLFDGLGTLRRLAITQSVVDAAVRAVVELAEQGRGDGSHRVSPADAIIGACAAANGCAVLHYDKHYDRLAEVLGFTSLWLAPAGSVS